MTYDFYFIFTCSHFSMMFLFSLFIQDDFQNYGIKIRVKYRSTEPLLDLSGTHHSGGERAVATALYMLAMQELTQVPFRCVDEINQVCILTTVQSSVISYNNTFYFERVWILSMSVVFLIYLSKRLAGKQAPNISFLPQK